MESGQFHNCVRIMASRSCFCSVYIQTIYIIEAWAIVYYLRKAVQSFITVIVNSFMLFLFVLGKYPLNLLHGSYETKNHFKQMKKH